MKRLIVVPVLVLALALGFRARSAGMTTHMFIGEEAIELVSDPALSALLHEYRDTALCGSISPDLGGGLRLMPGQKRPGNEMYWAHAPEFIEAYLARVLTTCPPPFDGCGQTVVHFLGTAAHVMEDCVYDELFLTQVRKHDRAGIARGNYDLDTTLDLVLLVDHDRAGVIPRYWVPVDDVIAAYQAGGLSYSPWQVRAGSRIHQAGLIGERVAAPLVHDRDTRITPWGAANIYSSPGGVAYDARVVARYWEALWAILNGRPEDATPILGTYPEDGGGLEADGFITVYFTRAARDADLNPGTFILLDPDGRPVPARVRIPRSERSEYTYICSLVPEAPLAAQGDYTWTLAAGIRDVTGREWESPFTARVQVK